MTRCVCSGVAPWAMWMIIQLLRYVLMIFRQGELRCDQAAPKSVVYRTPEPVFDSNALGSNSEQQRGQPPLVIAGNRRLQPEHIEHRQRGLAGGTVCEGPIEPDRFEQFIERSRVVGPGSEQNPPPIPRAGV